MVLLNGRLIVEVGDITRKPVDAIVNAANSSLMGGGGVDGAIHAVGGPEILAACREIRDNEYPDGLPAGDAVITTGGRLPAGYVIHTVGPVWKDGKSGEEQLLTSAYLTSLSLAVDNEVETIAFPAISTGVYGYPREKAAPAVYEALKAWCAKYPLPEKIYLIFYKEQDRQIFLTYLNRPKTLAERS